MDVTGVCSSAKADLVRSIGADRVIDYTRDDITDGGHRYDVILDTGGQPVAAAAPPRPDPPRNAGLFTRRLLYLCALCTHPSALKFRLGRAESRGLVTDPGPLIRGAGSSGEYAAKFRGQLHIRRPGYI